MNGRTPGPWRNGRAMSNGQEAIIGDGDTVVALIPDATMGCTFNVHDARLIAAATDGLVAGVEMLAVVRAAIANGDWKVDGRCDPEMAIRHMRKFIARATQP